METATVVHNRTGAAINANEVTKMLEAVRDLSPQIPISTLKIEEERLTYIATAATVGSVPPPVSKKAAKKKGKATQAAEASDVLLDKLGERIAFERTGTRLYDALICKHMALSGADEELIPTADALMRNSPGPPAQFPASGETVLETLQRIRAEELGHFHVLCDVVTQLGGDPTAQTPSADVTAAASMGLMQAITDPRTTMAQCLNTILTAELTDNAGWELLGELATNADRSDLAEQFAQALAAERAHLAIIQGWLRWLLINEAGTAAVRLNSRSET